MAPLFLFFFLYRVSPVVIVIRWHLQMRVKFIGRPATLLTWQSHLQNGECHAHYCKQFAPFVPPDKWQKGQMAQNIFQAPWRRQSEMLPKFCCQHTHTHTHVPQRAKHTHTHTCTGRESKGRRICTMYALRRSFGGLAPRTIPPTPECPALPVRLQCLF